MKFVIALSLATFLVFLNFQNAAAIKSAYEYDIFKLYADENLKMCNEREQKFIYLNLLNNTGNEKTVLLLEQKSLSDKVNRFEISQTNLAETLKTCQEKENKTTFQLAQCRAENVKQTEPITLILNRNLKNLYKELLPFMTATTYPGFEKYTIMSSARLGLTPLVYSEPLMPELNLGPVVNDITTQKYQTTVPPCEKNSQNSRSILIVVLSAPGNFEKRTKIRETWKTHIDMVKTKGLVSTIHFAFFLGQPEINSLQIKIKEENAKFKDIIQISELLDSPQNQTLKMVEVLKWANTYCSKIDFLIKVNDDMYLNVHYLSFFVKTYYQIGKMTIYGDSTNINYDDRPKAPNNNGPKKNDGIMLDAWPWSSYPNYINGSIYIVHGTAILPLLAAVQTTPMIPYEDIYLTGICAEKARIKTQYSYGRTCVSVLKHRNDLQLDPRLFISWKVDEQSQIKFMTHYGVNNFYTIGRVKDEYLDIKFQNNVSYLELFPGE